MFTILDKLSPGHFLRIRISIWQVLLRSLSPRFILDGYEMDSFLGCLNKGYEGSVISEGRVYRLLVCAGGNGLGSDIFF